MRRFFYIFSAVALAIIIFAVSQNAYAAGVCGYADGSNYSSSPQAVGSLCATGTPGAVTGSGPWNWTCTDGASVVNCSSGLCGVSVGGACNNAIRNGCSAGSPINMTSDITNDYWYCSGANGGSNSPRCSKTKAVANQCRPAFPTELSKGACTLGSGAGEIVEVTNLPGDQLQQRIADLCQSINGGCCYFWPWGTAPVGQRIFNVSDYSNPVRFSSGRLYSGRIMGSANSPSARFDTQAHNFPYVHQNNNFTAYMECGNPTTPTPIAGTCNNATVNGCSSGAAINITSNTSTDYWYCSGANGGANSSQCSKAKPVTYTYSWVQGGFGSCSASCGGGTQTQSVICRRNDGVTAADSNCSGTKPATSQSCNTQACAPRWVCHTGWTYNPAVHTTMGRTAAVTCQRNDGHVTPMAVIRYLCNTSGIPCTIDFTALVNAITGAKPARASCTMTEDFWPRGPQPLGLHPMIQNPTQVYTCTTDN